MKVLSEFLLNVFFFQSTLHLITYVKWYVTPPKIFVLFREKCRKTWYDNTAWWLPRFPFPFPIKDFFAKYFWLINDFRRLIGFKKPKVPMREYSEKLENFLGAYRNSWTLDARRCTLEDFRSQTPDTRIWTLDCKTLNLNWWRLWEKWRF